MPHRGVLGWIGREIRGIVAGLRPSCVEQSPSPWNRFLFSSVFRLQTK